MIDVNVCPDCDTLLPPNAECTVCMMRAWAQEREEQIAAQWRELIENSVEATIFGWLYDALEDIRSSTNHEWTQNAIARVMEKIPTGEQMRQRLWELELRHTDYRVALLNAWEALELVRGTSAMPPDIWERYKHIPDERAQQVQSFIMKVHNHHREQPDESE